MSHSATLWTVAFQAPLSMGFSRQEYWSGFPCPPPGNLDIGIKPESLTSPALEVCSLPLLPHKKPFSLAYLTKLSLKFALGQNWLKGLVGFGLEFIILGRRKLKNQTCLVWRGLASLGGEGNGTPL